MDSLEDGRRLPVFDKENGKRFLLTYLDMDCECVNGDYHLHVAIQWLDKTTDEQVTYLVVCQKCRGWMFHEVPYIECDEFMNEILYHEKNEIIWH